MSIVSFILENILSIFPHKKTSEVIIDVKTFKEGETKIESVWSWTRMKNEKFAISKRGDKIEIKKIEKR